MRAGLDPLLSMEGNFQRIVTAAGMGTPALANERMEYAIAGDSLTRYRELFPEKSLGI